MESPRAPGTPGTPGARSAHRTQNARGAHRGRRGRVTVGGHDHLVAVLSDGNATLANGITLVEAAAKAAVSVFAPA
ncbi:hypothetical protein ABZ330_15255 [Streptomyces sp. NPDC006172]|uniref:hypothetical protein n=1 Tax=Streptomyces sp. NPDC006172 TaxID=3154470 RepID=UPI003404BF76